MPAEAFSLSNLDDHIDDDEAWLRGDPADAADVDLALAAVASLSVMSDREAEAEAAAPPPARPTPRRAARLAAPGLTAPRRGSPVSLAVGLLLIAGGATWTLASTTGTPIDPLLIGAAGAALLLLAMLIGWLASGRWARGLLFLGSTAAAGASLTALMLTTPGLEPALAYPLLLLAPGLGFLITALLGRPASPRLLLPGATLIAAAAVGVAFNAGLIAVDLSALTALIQP